MTDQSKNFRIFPDLPHSNMIWVEGGTFQMGSEAEDAHKDESPIHEVTMPDFWIGQYLVTQALWKNVMGKENNPSQFKGENRPVEQVSWHNIVDNFLPALEVQTGKNFRLPSEAEWEYVARGGLLSEGYEYAGSNSINEAAWYRNNSHIETKSVGLKVPNELGVYDMSGNVWEWCLDHWHENYKNAPTDGSIWVNKENTGSNARVVRGGSWYLNAQDCRTSFRFDFYPDYRDYFIGFRLVFFSQ